MTRPLTIEDITRFYPLIRRYSNIGIGVMVDIAFDHILHNLLVIGAFDVSDMIFGLARRAPGRWLREKSAWTHYGGNRSGAGSRSARGSTMSPTVDPFGAHDGDRPSAPGVLARACHRGGR